MTRCAPTLEIAVKRDRKLTEIIRIVLFIWYQLDRWSYFNRKMEGVDGISFGFICAECFISLGFLIFVYYNVAGSPIGWFFNKGLIVNEVLFLN